MSTESNVMARERLGFEGLWNGAELGEQQYPGFGAWKSVKDDIDSHLENAVKTPGVTAFSLCSGPATGKSTTLMRHISELARASKAPRRVLYVVATEVEAQYISSWLWAHQALDTGDGVGGVRGVQVMTTETMVKMFTEDGMHWPDHLTIVLDINWYPTVDDEVALALVLHRAGQIKESHRLMDIHMAIVLLMSGFESARTIQAFKKCLGNMKHVRIKGYHIPPLTYLEGDWKNDVRRSIGSWDRRGRMIVAGDDDVYWWRRLPLEEELGEALVARDPTVPGDWILEENFSSLKKHKAIFVHGEVPFAVGLRNVTLVICSGEMEGSVRLDPGILQAVPYKRQMTISEVIRVLSWGVRSDQYGSSTNVVFAAPVEGYGDLKEPDRDDLGKAWNQDLPFLLLKILKVWPGLTVNRLPTRPCLDFHALTDRMRRFVILDCIKEQGMGWKCTELGLEILDIWAKLGGTMSFNVVFLLARVTLMIRHSRPGLLVVVLLHMAAIAHVGTKSITDAVPESAYSKFLEVPGLEVDTEVGSNIAELVFTFAQYMGIPLTKVDDNNWDWSILTQDDVATIERELMWAWLHQTVMFWPSPYTEADDVVTDMVSFEKFSISMDREAIEVSLVREESKRQNKASGAFYAIYEGVEEDQGSSAGRESRYRCQGVTWIPGTAFVDVESKSGCLWPDAVGRRIAR
ncbi:hypothetical protein CIB48_g5501 [Xylaria polymorpha]|nr:hypothetical protein CIB48_g5501 [Xylaria polymorpha]